MDFTNFSPFNPLLVRHPTIIFSALEPRGENSEIKYKVHFGSDVADVAINIHDTIHTLMFRILPNELNRDTEKMASGIVWRRHRCRRRWHKERVKLLWLFNFYFYSVESMRLSGTHWQRDTKIWTQHFLAVVSLARMCNEFVFSLPFSSLWFTDSRLWDILSISIFLPSIQTFYWLFDPLN